MCDSGPIDEAKERGYASWKYMLVCDPHHTCKEVGSKDVFFIRLLWSQFLMQATQWKSDWNPCCKSLSVGKWNCFGNGYVINVGNYIVGACFW